MKLQGRQHSLSCIGSASRTCSGKPDLLRAKPDLLGDLITVSLGPGTERFGPAAISAHLSRPVLFFLTGRTSFLLTRRPVSTPRVGRARKINDSPANIDAIPAAVPYLPLMAGSCLLLFALWVVDGTLVPIFLPANRHAIAMPPCRHHHFHFWEVRKHIMCVHQNGGKIRHLDGYQMHEYMRDGAWRSSGGRTKQFDHGRDENERIFCWRSGFCPGKNFRVFVLQGCYFDIA